MQRAWVVGRGGLLGRHVEAELRVRGHEPWVPPRDIPWDSPSDAESLLRRLSSTFAAADGSWTVYWCAGAGVTASGRDALTAEVHLFQSLLSELDRDRGAGRVFLTSSAGGVYAASHGPPFTEDTTPRPLSGYGQAKLAMEAAARAWAGRTGHRLLIGRLANLYGPGQNTEKPQGLVTHLLRANLQRSPLTIYVPLETVRDYVFVADAARIVVDATQSPALRAGHGEVKVVATGRGMTIASVLGEIRRVVRRPAPVVLGSSPAAAYQARDLRLRSVRLTEVDRVPHTLFPVGLQATLADLQRRAGCGVCGGATYSPRPAPIQVSDSRLVRHDSSTPGARGRYST